MLLNLNVESRGDTFYCPDSSSMPCAHLNSEGSTLMFHLLLICTVKRMLLYKLKSFGAHGHIAFCWVKLLSTPALKTGHRHAGSLHIQPAHCGTLHHIASFSRCPVDHAGSAHLSQTPFSHHLHATVSPLLETVTFQFFI